MSQDWILTISGQEFDLAAPRPRSITLPDIAHSLSLINRFTGHTCRPYSVAEHSLLVCEIAEREMRLDVHGRLYALMHDAHEAYVGDASTIAKRVIGTGWHELERRASGAVHSAFALRTARTVHRDAVRRADLMALATERAQLLPPGEAWGCLQGIDPVPWADLMGSRCGFTWRDWRQAFTDKYHELEYERQALVAAYGGKPSSPLGEQRA
jgi:5'-deoxynucleotidase YfbR-like HD superfamily hydrolase